MIKAGRGAHETKTQLKVNRFITGRYLFHSSSLYIQYIDHCITLFPDLIYLSCQVNKELINIYDDGMEKSKQVFGGCEICSEWTPRLYSCMIRRRY